MTCRSLLASWLEATCTWWGVCHVVHIGWCPVPNLRDGVLRKVRLGMEVALMEFFGPVFGDVGPDHLHIGSLMRRDQQDVQGVR